MPYSDTSIDKLIINTLTKEEYDALVNSGTINPRELYMVTDDTYPTTSEFANVAFSGEYSDLLNTPTIPDISNMQTVTNMVDVINASSTNTTYPTASAVYNILGNIESLLHDINSGS